MHNQAINSLAFISTRYTATAVELASLMCASYVYTACQALDLRVLQLSFFRSLEPFLYGVNHKAFGALMSYLDFEELHLSIWDHFRVTWLVTANKDSEERYTHVVDSTMGVIVKVLLDIKPQAEGFEASSPAALAGITEWRSSVRKTIAETFTTVCARFFEKPDTASFLGLGSRAIYTYVRETLKVPLHRGLQDHPEPHSMFSPDDWKKRTIGSNISIIYEALRSGVMHEPLMKCLEECVINESGHRETSTADFNGWNGFRNGTPNTTSNEMNGEETRNGHTADAVFTNAYPEPNGLESKRRYSVSFGETDGKRRRSSLAAVQGSLTGL